MNRAIVANVEERWTMSPPGVFFLNHPLHFHEWWRLLLIIRLFDQVMATEPQ